jgi:hypothetical protein
MSECHEDGTEATGGPKTGLSTIQLRSIARPTILRLSTCWSFHSGQLLYSLIPIMIIEPAATTIEQIAGHSSRTATMAARPYDFSSHARTASLPRPFGTSV